jgi:hypothetical protein
MPPCSFFASFPTVCLFEPVWLSIPCLSVTPPPNPMCLLNTPLHLSLLFASSASVCHLPLSVSSPIVDILNPCLSSCPLSVSSCPSVSSSPVCLLVFCLFPRLLSVYPSVSVSLSHVCLLIPSPSPLPLYVSSSILCLLMTWLSSRSLSVS